MHTPATSSRVPAGAYGKRLRALLTTMRDLRAALRSRPYDVVLTCRPVWRPFWP